MTRFSRLRRRFQEVGICVKFGFEAKGFQATDVFDARITPGDAEKLSLLSSFQNLREDGTFCDVAFLCKGNLFRAHRVVISAWSRWLSALLSEGSSEEVVHLDLFEPEAFRAVLDYMYGLPFYVNVDTIDGLMKVPQAFVGV